MKCVVCKKGKTRHGHVTVTLERSKSTIVFRDVPADVCENCGEEYISEEVSKKLFALANRAVRSGVKVEVREYAHS